MNKQQELVIYVLPNDRFPVGKDINVLPNDEFIPLAKQYGKVLTLPLFIKAFNDGEINNNYDSIREDWVDVDLDLTLNVEIEKTLEYILDSGYISDVQQEIQIRKLFNKVRELN